MGATDRPGIEATELLLLSLLPQAAVDELIAGLAGSSDPRRVVDAMRYCKASDRPPGCRAKDKKTEPLTPGILLSGRQTSLLPGNAAVHSSAARTNCLPPSYDACGRAGSCGAEDTRRIISSDRVGPGEPPCLVAAETCAGESSLWSEACNSWTCATDNSD